MNNIIIFLFVAGAIISCNDMGAKRNPGDSARVKIINLHMAIQRCFQDNIIPSSLEAENINELYSFLLSRRYMSALNDGIKDPANSAQSMGVIFLREKLGYIIYSTNKYPLSDKALQDIRNANTNMDLVRMLKKHSCPTINYITMVKINNADISPGSGLILVWGKLDDSTTSSPMSTRTRYGGDENKKY